MTEFQHPNGDDEYLYVCPNCKYGDPDFVETGDLWRVRCPRCGRRGKRGDKRAAGIYWNSECLTIVRKQRHAKDKAK